MIQQDDTCKQNPNELSAVLLTIVNKANTINNFSNLFVKYNCVNSAALPKLDEKCFTRGFDSNIIKVI